MSEAAIVILNYNGEEMLRRFLPTVLDRSKYEVIIADNASTDGSIAYLRASHPSLKLIVLTENHGFSKGYNEALAQLEHAYDYYLLLNSDVEVTEGWDISLVSWLRERPAYAAVQPKILSQSRPRFFDYAGAGGGYIDRLGYPYCRGRVLDTVEEDMGQYDDEVEVDWVSGACMTIRTPLFHQLGGFDPVFFAHMEEIDLCWRLARSGWRLGYSGESTVYHVGGGTLSRTSPRKTYLNFRNNLLMLYKNLTTAGFLKVMGLRLVFDALACLHFLASGKQEHAFEVIRAYKDFFKMKGSVERRGALASKLPFQKTSKKVFSTVLAYYLWDKKKYPDL